MGSGFSPTLGRAKARPHIYFVAGLSNVFASTAGLISIVVNFPLPDCSPPETVNTVGNVMPLVVFHSLNSVV